MVGFRWTAHLAAIFVALVLGGCAATESFFSNMLRLEDQAAVAAPEAPTPVDRQVSPRVDASLSSYESGKAHFSSGRYGLALEAFEDAMQAESRSVRTLNAIGACYDQLRRYDLAIRFYEAALALEPNAPQTLNNLAYSYLLRSEWIRDQRYLAMAEDYLRSARKLAPHNPVVLGNMQLLAERQGKPTTPMVAPPFAARPAAGTLSVRRVEPYDGWIERVQEGTYYLVTQPPEDLTRRLRDKKIDPAIASVQHAEFRKR